MFAILAVVAFLIGLILTWADAGSGHLADQWVWVFAGLAFLALHTVTGYTPWRRP